MLGWDNAIALWLVFELFFENRERVVRTGLDRRSGDRAGWNSGSRCQFGRGGRRGLCGERFAGGRGLLRTVRNQRTGADGETESSGAAGEFRADPAGTGCCSGRGDFGTV